MPRIVDKPKGRFPISYKIITCTHSPGNPSFYRRLFFQKGSKDVSPKARSPILAEIRAVPLPPVRQQNDDELESRTRWNEVRTENRLPPIPRCSL